MGNKKRLPDYSTIIGQGTEIDGAIRFCGGIHIDGKVVGDVSGMSMEGCALTLARSGVIQGDLDVAYVALDGAVIGDVRAAYRAELASGARIEGDLYYGDLEMAQGAKVNGQLYCIDERQPLESVSLGVFEQEDCVAADSKAKVAESPAGDDVGSDKRAPRRDSNT